MEAVVNAMSTGLPGELVDDLNKSIWNVHKYTQNGKCMINCTRGGSKTCLRSDHC